MTHGRDDPRGGASSWQAARHSGRRAHVHVVEMSAYDGRSSAGTPTRSTSSRSEAALRSARCRIARSPGYGSATFPATHKASHPGDQRMHQQAHESGDEHHHRLLYLLEAPQHRGGRQRHRGCDPVGDGALTDDDDRSGDGTDGGGRHPLHERDDGGTAPVLLEVRRRKNRSRPSRRQLAVVSDYQGRTWATRRRLWVDRVASAWLIRRFIDPAARFLWIEHPVECPPDALGVDFDGAAFTHVGDRVTFEVLMAAFGLDADAALNRLGALVHVPDVGGEPVPEAKEFEAFLAGARERLPDNDALLGELTNVLDSFYTSFRRASA